MWSNTYNTSYLWRLQDRSGGTITLLVLYLKLVEICILNLKSYVVWFGMSSYNLESVFNKFIFKLAPILTVDKYVSLESIQKQYNHLNGYAPYHHLSDGQHVSRNRQLSLASNWSQVPLEPSWKLNPAWVQAAKIIDLLGFSCNKLRFKPTKFCKAMLYVESKLTQK